jgi:hypothetical protein
MNFMGLFCYRTDVTKHSLLDIHQYFPYLVYCHFIYIGIKVNFEHQMFN